MALLSPCFKGNSTLLVATSASEWIRHEERSARPFDKPLDRLGALSLSKRLRATSKVEGLALADTPSERFLADRSKTRFVVGAA